MSVNTLCAQSYTISTYAGGGVGDGKPAVGAVMNTVYGVAVDHSGNIYITDSYYNRVRNVNTSGIITTIAGGPAAAVGLDDPYGIAVDDSGNVYVADNLNNRIRKVDKNGIITTIAGTSSVGYSGDGGPATAARLFAPWDVAVDDSGNVYIADSQNNRIRKVDKNGIIRTVAGNGNKGYSGDGGLADSAALYEPADVTIDKKGNLYIADTYNNRIREVKNDTIWTIAGNGVQGYLGDGGPADSAEFYNPSKIVFDSKGDMYIADVFNQCIRKIHNDTITTVAGNNIMGFSGDGSLAVSAEMHYPSYIAMDDSDNLYVADTYNHRIREVKNDTINTVAGGSTYYCGDGGPADSAGMAYPTGVATDDSGNVYVADQYDNRIRKVNTKGIITTIAGNGASGYSGDGGPAINAQLYYPQDVAVDKTGNIYIADASNNCIRKINLNGIITTVAGNGASGFSGDGGPATAAKLSGPSSVAIDKAGNIYIADFFNQRIRKVSTAGIITTIAGNGTGAYGGDGGAAVSAYLCYPEGVAVDSSDNIFIADSYNNRIRKINTSGIISTIYGDGTKAVLNDPTDVAVDKKDNIYVADSYNSRVRILTNGGKGMEVNAGGNGISGFTGDGGPADSAEFYGPVAVAIDKVGNIYVADFNNQRIRKLSIVTGVNIISSVESHILLYPNPSNGIINLSYNMPADKSTLTITNMLGEVVDSKTINNPKGKITLDESALNEGIYFYTLTNKNMPASSGKFIIVR